MNDKEIDLKIAELKRIKEQNALYKKLSPAERRVEVAKDALLYVKKGFWTPQTAKGYVNLNKPILIKDDTCSWSPGKIDCTVCARGALFLGALNKFNNWDPREYNDIEYGEDLYEISSEEFGHVEEKLWSTRQVAEIEFVFESDDLGAAENWIWTDDNWDLVRQWKRQYKQPKARLIAILKNIIRNKGTFKMDDKFDIK